MLALFRSWLGGAIGLKQHFWGDRFVEAPDKTTLSQVRQRLASDFQLLTMAMLAAMIHLILLPLLVYRIWIGDVSAALGNVVIMLACGGIFAFAWFSGRTAIAGRLFAVAASVMCCVMVLWVHHNTHWVFSAMVANFVLVGWRFAVVANVIMALVVVFHGPAFSDTADLVSFLGAVATVGMFAVMFVAQTRIQRDHLTSLVMHDTLTGALSRRVLQQDLEHASAQAKRRKASAVVALLDLDDFKKVNDLQGHEVGDQVLVDLTRLVGTQSRKIDRFYRLGGEEFVLLLSETDRAGSEVALNKLHEWLREELRSPSGPVTVSIGAAASRSEESWEQWLDRADQAMYRAKSEGKDRVVFAD